MLQFISKVSYFEQTKRTVLWENPNCSKCDSLELYQFADV